MKENDVKVLVFSVNCQYYATDILEVERILGYEKPTKLPDSPDFVSGVINYEDKILPVIKLSKRFNIVSGESKEDAKIIVVKQNENRIGILVDLVSEVKDINSSNIEVTPDAVAGISKRYIKGLIKNDKDIIIFLNLSAILTEEEKALII